jgi:hypothetical protein
LSASTSATNTPGESPEPPTDSIASRANIVARTASTGSASPTAALRPSSNWRWKALASPSTVVPRLAPSPVFKP